MTNTRPTIQYTPRKRPEGEGSDLERAVKIINQRPDLPEQTVTDGQNGKTSAQRRRDLGIKD